MFSRLYRTILSVAPLRNQGSIEVTKNSAKCHFNCSSTSSYNAPTQIHGKLVSRKGLKCSAGVLFLQRQFLRNFCLLQQKEATPDNGHESAALQLKRQQPQHYDSSVLSLFNENLRNTSCSISSENDILHTQSNNQRQILPSGIQPTSSNSIDIHTNKLFRCANTKAICDQLPYNKYLDANLLRRLYSTSSDSKGSKDVTEGKTSEDLSSKKQNILTIPNALTMSRICLTPLLGYLVVQENFSIACGLFFFAGLTDLFDGYIARRYPSQISAFGSFLDPLADKILISVLFVSLTFVKLIPLPLALLVIGRDIGLIVAAFYVRYISLSPPITLTKFFDATHGSAQLKPMMISKINTVLQLGLVTVSLAAPVFGYVDHVFLHYLWYLTAITTTATGVGYMFAKDTFKILNKKRKPQK